MGLVQYLKDTRGELHHVAWPTRVQTIVFTILVVLVSVLTALYLGLFDYIFTSGLGEVVERLPNSGILEVDAQPVDTSNPSQDFIISTTTE